MEPRWFRAGASRSPFSEGTVRIGELELDVRARDQGSGQRIDWTVRNPSRQAVTLARIGLVLDASPTVVLEQGWQSWSPLRTCSPTDVRPERRDVPAWRRAMYFADPELAGHAVVGDQFLVTDAGAAGFLDGRGHLGIVEAEPQALTAWALLDGVPLGAGEERLLGPLWFGDGEPGPLYGEYAAHWGAEADARAHTRTPSGWCSWYHYRASVTPSDVRANLAQAAAHGLEVVQIDDGYQAAVGQWLSPRPSWSEGTAVVAAGIRAAGLQAGIWTAPFLVAENGSIARDHPQWVLGRAMHNPVWWGGWSLALDTTNPAVLDHLTSTFAVLTAEGFGYHKIDFLYAAALAGRRHDPMQTRAQALRKGLDAVRAGIGDDAFLLGCGSPFGPAVGVVDAMRVSPDVAPWWLPQHPLPGLDEAASCARNAVVSSVLRAPLHRRLWANDPDCVLLRPVGGGLEPGQSRLIGDTVAGTGGLVMVSDDLTGYGPEQWGRLEHVRAVAASADGPLELVDPFADTLTVRSSRFELRIGPSGSDGRLERR